MSATAAQPTVTVNAFTVNLLGYCFDVDPLLASLLDLGLQADGSVGCCERRPGGFAGLCLALLENVFDFAQVTH